MHHINPTVLAALLPLCLIGLGFVIYCWVDIAKNKTRYLPKWLWVIIAAASIPLGGIIYLLVGKSSDDKNH